MRIGVDPRVYELAETLFDLADLPIAVHADRVQWIHRLAEQLPLAFEDWSAVAEAAALRQEP